MKTEILNGHLIDPRHGIDRVANLYLDGDKVAAIDQAPSNWKANESINAQGLIVCPGLVDAAVRLRAPGNEYKATLESEMRAAVSGGVTSLVCQPDTNPPLDEPGLIEMLKFRVRSQNLGHVYPLGALTVGLKGDVLTQMGELREAGCVAFSQAERGIVDTQILLRAMQYAATFCYPVWLRPQDVWLSKGGVAHEGEVASRLGLPGIPAVAETAAVAQLLRLAREAGCQLHLCRLSSAESVTLVEEAKASGQAVTCDVSINHIHFSEIDIGHFDSRFALMPPLRSTADRDALRSGLQRGAIDVLTSDHTPVDVDAKELPFGEAEPGASGVELLLSAALKWASESKVALPEALRRVTDTPARLLNLPGGHLAVGAPADVCVFDAKAWRGVSAASLLSEGKSTPFTGIELPGAVRGCWVRGRRVVGLSQPALFCPRKS